MILAGLGDVYCSQTIQDALFHMITHWYQLIVIAGMKNLENLCKVIQTIRTINKIPILVLEAEYTEDRIECTKAGADVVLDHSSNDLEIKYQALAIIRRHANWSEKLYRNERRLQYGLLKIECNEQRCFWKGNEIGPTKHEFDFIYFLVKDHYTWMIRCHGCSDPFLYIKRYIRPIKVKTTVEKNVFFVYN